MKIKVNDKEIFELTQIRKQVICNDIPEQEIDADLERRLKYIVEHKYEQCMKRLKEEWTPKLKAAGVKSIPLDDDAFADLVFKRQDYKNRSARMLEEEQSE